jgi:glucosyl-dolichyl phosphate glucuronosyltransferase
MSHARPPEVDSLAENNTSRPFRLSVVIPTYNRPTEVEAILRSLLEQDARPNEIVVVDDSISNETSVVVQKLAEAFRGAGINLLHLPAGPIRRGLPGARNAGVRASSGDIVVFLDDDVLPHAQYLNIVGRAFNDQPNIVGAQGFVLPEPRGILREALSRMFFLYHFEEGRCSVMPSISTTYAKNAHGMIPCEWLSGSNQAFRRTVFQTLTFDENLKKYADGEDLDFSYRVFKQHPNGLVLISDATIVHKTSTRARLPSRELIEMREVYGLYLFYKLFPANLRNRFVYLWSRVGRVLFAVGRVVLRREGAREEVSMLRGALRLAWVHRHALARGDLSGFNRRILQ